MKNEAITCNEQNGATTMTTNQRIYVACLASYNNGRLYGAWIDANQDADDIETEIAAMLRGSPYPNVTVDCPTCDGAGRDSPMDGLAAPSDDTCATCKGTGKVSSAEEWAIHDHEGFEGIKLGEHASPATVAALATMLDEHEGAFVAWWNNGNADESDPDSWDDAFRDAYQGTYRSLDEWAEEYVESAGMLSEMPENLRAYFDFERFARDCEMGGDIWSTDGGNGVYVFNNH